MSDERRKNGTEQAPENDSRDEKKAEEGSKEPPKDEKPKEKTEEQRVIDALKADVERLRTEVRLRDKLIDERDKTLREYIASHKEAVQEFDAIKERLRRDVDAQVERAKGKFLGGLLEVLDNLDRSLSAPAPEEAKGKALLAGVKMVREQFMNKLKENAVARMEAVVGQAFDPERHEAITTLPPPDASRENTIAHETRAGYTLGDKVLRVAQVVVFKG